MESSKFNTETSEEKSPVSKIETEKLETPQELSEKFLATEEKGTMDKIKNVLNILRPHELADAMHKLVGTISIASGIEISRIAFLHPEQLDIFNKGLVDGTVTPLKIVAGCSILFGGILFSEGIQESISTIRIDKKIKADREEYYRQQKERREKMEENN